MRSDDLDRFAEVVNGLASVKTGARLSKEILKIWWNAFQDWSIEDFSIAAAHLLKTQKWMPDPADFNALRKAGEPTAGEAWGIAVENCLSWRTGSSAAGELIDRVVASIGGYRSIAMANQDTALPHIERRFKEAYAELAEREPIRESLPQIAKPTHVALRGPAPLAKCLPRELQRAEPAAAELPAPPAAPKVVIADSVRVERLARAMPTATDDELAKVARVDAASVRQVRAALESAA